MSLLAVQLQELCLVGMFLVVDRKVILDDVGLVLSKDSVGQVAVLSAC
jgi:hypothetical protein